MVKKKRGSLMNEFKSFITKGNVIDLAVAVIIGGAFGKIVSSFVNDILMPIIGLALGKVNFNDLKWALAVDAEGNITSSVNYGTFIQFVIDFVIVAACVFLIVKLITVIKRKTEELKNKKEEEAIEVVPAAPPAPSKEELLLTEIRDLLKERK